MEDKLFSVVEADDVVTMEETVEVVGLVTTTLVETVSEVDRVENDVFVEEEREEDEDLVDEIDEIDERVEEVLKAA